MPTNSTGPIVRLRVKDGGSTRIYRLYGRGAQYCFIKDDQTHTHVLDIPLEKWQADNFRVAKDIFQEQRAIVVIPDFVPVEAAEASEGPEKDELPEETARLIADLESKIADLERTIADNQKLLDASAKRIEELIANETPTSTGPDEQNPDGSKMTPSEAGKILGNGIAEPEDAEAAKVLSEAAKSADGEKPKEQEPSRQQRAAITRAANKAKKAAEKAE